MEGSSSEFIVFEPYKRSSRIYAVEFEGRLAFDKTERYQIFQFKDSDLIYVLDLMDRLKKYRLTRKKSNYGHRTYYTFTELETLEDVKRISGVDHIRG